LEEQKGEWGFKALKQMIKINFKLGRLDEMMSKYKLLLTYIKVRLHTFEVTHLFKTSIITSITVSSNAANILPATPHKSYIAEKRRKNGIQLCTLLLDITNVKSKNQVYKQGAKI